MKIKNYIIAFLIGVVTVLLFIPKTVINNTIRYKIKRNNEVKVSSDILIPKENKQRLKWIKNIFKRKKK